MTAKVCISCGQQKPEGDFYKNKNMKDGRINKCGSCYRKQCTDYRRATLEKRRQKEVERSRARNQTDKQKGAVCLWKSENRAFVLAQKKLQYAVISGLVSRWPVCAVPDCERKPEAHHPDYDRPLDVVWLCRSHHQQAHHSINKEST